MFDSVYSIANLAGKTIDSIPARILITLASSAEKITDFREKTGLVPAYCSLRNEMGRNEMERNEMGRNKMKICSLRNENL